MTVHQVIDDLPLIQKGFPVTIFVDGNPIHGELDWQNGLLDPVAHVAYERAIEDSYRQGRVPEVARCSGHVERM